MIVFFFDMSGQRCRTTFDDMQTTINWIFTMYEKGWLMPVQLSDGNNMYSAKAILEMIGEV